MAEYREIRHVPASLNRSLKSKNGLGTLPDTFTLNTGHVRYFYNKGKYLRQRFYEIKQELKLRGYNLSSDIPDIDCSVFLRNNLYNNWTPSLEDYKVVADRIKNRIDEKEHLYKDKERFLNYYKELENACVSNSTH